MSIDEKLKKVKVARCGILDEKCYFCMNRAVIDTPTKMGPFAYLCVDHIPKYAAPHWESSARRIGPIPGVPEDPATQKPKRRLERY